MKDRILSLSSLFSALPVLLLLSLSLPLAVAVPLLLCEGVSADEAADEAAGVSAGTPPGADKRIPDVFPVPRTPPVPYLIGSLMFDRPDMMMRTWYCRQFDLARERWQRRYDTLTDPQGIEQYQREQRAFFLRQLDMPTEKTALNARITKKLVKPWFRVESVVFESQPRFYVTATLFLPLEKAFKPPYPAVVMACGHSDNGKGAETYQRVGMLGAVNGLAVLVVDPLDQGERLEHLDSVGNPYARTVVAHNLAASGGIPIGRSLATYMIWDLIRSVDYLQSRNDIVADRIGTLGNSGGGTQSSYLMALEPRIYAAAPACYLSSIAGRSVRLMGPPDDEQAIFGQLGFGLDHPDYCIMRAPKPTLMCTATRDFFRIEDCWETFRLAKRIYGRFGLGERMELVETDETHGYTVQLRVAGIRWMLRWLAGRDVPIVEDESLPILSDDEIRVLPKPGIMTLAGAKTVYDLDRARGMELAAARCKTWEHMTPEAAAQMVRRCARFRSLDEIPLPTVRLENSNLSRIFLESEPEIYTADTSFFRTSSPVDFVNRGRESRTERENQVEPVYLPVRARWTDSPEMTIVIDDAGLDSPFVRNAFAKTKGDVLAVELRGWGDTQGHGGRHNAVEWFGPDRNEFYLAHLLGKTYVGMRVEDLFSVVRYCRMRGKTSFRVMARGGAETVALHAAVSEPGLFTELVSFEPLPDWSATVAAAPCPVVLTDLVYGALKEYDKSDLRKMVRRSVK